MSISCQSSCLKTVLTLFRRSSTRTQTRDTLLMKSEAILGTNSWRTRSPTACFLAMSPCQSTTRFTKWCWMNSTTTQTTRWSALRPTDTIRSQPPITCWPRKRSERTKIFRITPREQLTWLVVLTGQPNPPGLRTLKRKKPNWKLSLRATRGVRVSQSDTIETNNQSVPSSKQHRWQPWTWSTWKTKSLTFQLRKNTKWSYKQK